IGETDNAMYTSPNVQAVRQQIQTVVVNDSQVSATEIIGLRLTVEVYLRQTFPAPTPVSTFQSQITLEATP
ncbi:MAG: hypothetical protein KC615_13570, partial [Anaerolineae bacterium]|nr:hypothetical protein [Anaerolineae bacterium]